jgi:hypothetical protein
MSTAASPSAIGGAAGDAGVEYRRAVAAYVVVHGLSDVPLPRFGFRGRKAVVADVSLETDDPVDDLRVTYTAGGSTFVQAKRRLTDGPSFASAAQQWKAAAKAGIDVERHRLVIAAGTMSGPMRQLQALLERISSDTFGGLTQAEHKTLRRLDRHLEGLTTFQRQTLLRRAAIVDLDVEEPSSSDARVAIGLLGRTVCAPGDAEHAWRTLVASAGQMARRRAGLGISGWQAELRGADVELSIAGDTRSAQLERTHRAVERYKSDLRHAAGELDLRGLGARSRRSRLTPGTRRSWCSSTRTTPARAAGSHGRRCVAAASSSPASRGAGSRPPWQPPRRNWSTCRTRRCPSWSPSGRCSSRTGAATSATACCPP